MTALVECTVWRVLQAAHLLSCRGDPAEPLAGSHQPAGWDALLWRLRNECGQQICVQSRVSSREIGDHVFWRKSRLSVWERRRYCRKGANHLQILVWGLDSTPERSGYRKVGVYPLQSFSVVQVCQLFGLDSIWQGWYAVKEILETSE